METEELIEEVRAEEIEDIDSLKVPVRVTVGKKALAEHQRIINRLGIHGANGLTPMDIEKYLQDHSYEVYPPESVKKYMDRKVAEINAKTSRRRNSYYSSSTNKWRWVPLRMAQSRNGAFCKQVVPVEVLMTAEKIFNDLGDQITFEVTEIYKSARRMPTSGTLVHGDPFMCVRVGNNRYILERWDEPGFRS